ncbi:hypothetical protein H1P_1220010 [Hyella patelloides LEGE 07179]|uniref:Uncharacterized protein n=1 Tax=Hyella patelloides LEGE 07179 TaxID=945734 RepID=A0A563VK90_9CYAN|nr:hypothetical protein H1P_1220010 [Hyella patelloides LEGE 07179]
MVYYDEQNFIMQIWLLFKSMILNNFFLYVQEYHIAIAHSRISCNRT